MTTFIDTSLSLSNRDTLSYREKPFSDRLSGKNAFYEHPEYINNTFNDLHSAKILPTSYTWNTEHKIMRIAKQILPIFAFSIGLCLIGKVSLIKIAVGIGTYKLIQLVAGLLILPASLTTFSLNSSRTESNNRLLNKLRVDTLDETIKNKWMCKRITIEVDGYKIDSIIIGKPSLLDKGRWTLVSNGNGMLYEFNMLSKHSITLLCGNDDTLRSGNDDTLKKNNTLRSILNEYKSNAILFNYPGVGASSGLPNKQAMVKAYRAILTFLEDKEKGIGATEIIGYGHSIGGGIQGEVLKTHSLKNDIKYIFIKDKTFSSLSEQVSLMIGKILGSLIKLLGWEMDSVESSKKLQVKEIIIQTTKRTSGHNLKNIDDLADNDQLIIKESCLAFKLLKEKATANKYFLGTTSSHNQPLSQHTIQRLSEMIHNTFSSKDEQMA
ncbi:MAG: CPn0927/CPn0928 family alpha/beta hydrolase fold protein [Candidatus Rhabdochlamydia sp.]